MSNLEIPVTFLSDDRQLIGILHQTDRVEHRGVLIVVGGPQYRVGSHRQFLLLARYLARHNIPVLRFDYHGMGDSDGDEANFESVDNDICSAIDTFFKYVPELTEVVIWGLCDAASAALLYAYRDHRIYGLVLLNPWVRTETTMARTYLRHYYVKKIVDPSFWKGLFRGDVNIRKATGSFAQAIGAAVGQEETPALAEKLITFRENQSSKSANVVPYTSRMLQGMSKFKGHVLFILSGDDLTAAEFKDTVAGSRRWRKLIRRPTVTWYDFPESNHTFSRREWRDRVAQWTLEWLKSC